MSLPKIHTRLTGYQIGYGSLFIIPAIPAGIYLMLGYQTQPGLAFASIIVLVGSVGAVFARGLIDRLFPLDITPRIRSGFGQFFTMLAAYGIIKAAAAPIIASQIASISAYGTTTDLAILVQTSIMETLVVQYFLFYGFLVAGMYLFRRHYYPALIAATLIATPWAYEFHYYVYNAIPAVWNWVFFSFMVLNVAYGLTGNIVVPMIAHLLIDTLQIVVSLLFPSACPGLLGVC